MCVCVCVCNDVIMCVCVCVCNDVIMCVLVTLYGMYIQGEWTTQKKSRRSKVNDGGSEFIIAPGDNQLPGRQSGAGGGGRGTNRAGKKMIVLLM